MSPFKGQGANQAVIDAVALARALHQSSLGFATEAAGIRVGAAAPRYAVHSAAARNCRHDAALTSCEGIALPHLPELPLAQALHAFEENMLARSTVKAQCSNDAAAILHSRGDACAHWRCSSPIHAPTEVLLEVNCPRAPALAALLRTDIKAVESSSACC